MLQAVEMDFTLGSAIADDIVPCAFKYYTGEAEEDGEYTGDEDDDDEDDDEDDDDDDDEDEDDSDEDGDAGAKRKGRGMPPPPANQEPGECKQQ